MGFTPPSVPPPTALQDQRQLRHTLRFLTDGDLRKKARWLLIVGVVLSAPLILRLMANSSSTLPTMVFVVTGVAAAVSLMGALICAVFTWR
jgi:hypothetical protein